MQQNIRLLGQAWYVDCGIFKIFQFRKSFAELL